jgi:hypothetical protein
MSKWNDLAYWMYADARTDRGFWYSHPLNEISGLDEQQLFWVPDENSLCMLWHAAHIAHRERTHIARIIQGIEGEIIPPQYEVFGVDWCSVDDVRESIDSVGNVIKWIEEVRDGSTKFIASLDEADFHKVPPTADGLSIGHWIFITVGHGAIHIGKMQLLRNMLQGDRDNPC